MLFEFYKTLLENCFGINFVPQEVPKIDDDDDDDDDDFDDDNGDYDIFLHHKGPQTQSAPGRVNKLF